MQVAGALSPAAEAGGCSRGRLLKEAANAAGSSQQPASDCPMGPRQAASRQAGSRPPTLDGRLVAAAADHAEGEVIDVRLDGGGCKRRNESDQTSEEQVE